MAAKSMDDIAAFLKELRFRKTLFGGVSEKDVWKKLELLQREYRSAYEILEAGYEARLKERDETIAALKEREKVPEAPKKEEPAEAPGEREKVPEVPKKREEPAGAAGKRDEVVEVLKELDGPVVPSKERLPAEDADG